ncbi:MAG: hypothetical protein DDT18_00976 [Actinobacteria bacterium]|nr:hypothetical protein [Actinomycetota bacterium]
MPLKKGKSKSVIGSNIRELVNSFKKKGMIGTSKPESFAKARKQAIAIAFDKARREKC